MLRTAKSGKWYMNNSVTITPEIARLAQQKAKLLGTTLADEIAKVVVEEAILSLDPELNFLLDSPQAYSEHDVLAQTFGINDLLVNGHHIDVRAVDSQGQVSVNRALIGTSYLQAGTLVVKMDGPFVGGVVGHISSDSWQQADAQFVDEIFASVCLPTTTPLNLAETLQLACSSMPVKAKTDYPAVSAQECVDLISGGSALTVKRRREILEQCLYDQAVRTKVTHAQARWGNAKIGKIVETSAVWNHRVETLSQKLTGKFARLKSAEIKQIICKIGEAYGGQPEAPGFRKALLKSLVKAELMARLQGVDLARINQVVDKVLSGQPIIDAVNDFIKNKVALEMAIVIRQQRQSVEGFMTATAEEIGMAFQQLALQPAYATHSQDTEAGVEAINDALGMLEAGELAQEIAELEDDLF